MTRLPMFKVTLNGAPCLLNFKPSANARHLMTHGSCGEAIHAKGAFNQDRMAEAYARVMIAKKHGACIPGVKLDEAGVVVTVENDYAEGTANKKGWQMRPRFVVWREKGHTDRIPGRGFKRATYVDVPGEELFRFEIPNWNHVPTCTETRTEPLQLAA